MRHFLCCIILWLAGGSLTAQDVSRTPPVASCPLTKVAAQHRVYPDNVYVTWVLDGKVLLRHQRQLERSPHSVVALDSMPSALEPDEIEAIEFPVGAAARHWETCPTVRVVSIRTRGRPPSTRRPRASRPAA